MNQNQTADKKVIILALDGLDPKIIDEGIEKGRLPNIKKLKDEGYYSTLGTTIPPQSPVAWASFITGEPPQKHKIYDFITRDPKNYSLGLSYTDNKPFVWQVQPFWEKTTEAKIPVVSLFLPDTFPAPSKMNGKMVAGMGVPDITGTQGSLTFMTTGNPSAEDFRGKIIRLKNQSEQEVEIEGPRYKDIGQVKTSKIPLKIKKSGQSIVLTVQNQTITLKRNEFSDWVEFKFEAGLFNKVEGIGKFYLKSIGPQLEIYLSPINFHPKKPFRQISYPASYAKDLANEYGLFYTQGLPIDSWALEQGIMDEKAFLSHTESILKEREKIHFGELTKFKSGIFISYFGFADTMSHMFWRYKDTGGEFENVILDYYQILDGIIGQTARQLDKDSTLVILSDHGFESFDYEVNLNSWLYENGYLVLKPGESSSDELFDSVDWTKTKAFSAGYNGIFINLKGRENQGIVDRSQYLALIEEISDNLMGLNNPISGSSIVKKIYSSQDLGTQKGDLASPDLFVGFYKGARGSWDSAVGKIEGETVRERESKWSGDHLFDPSEVPGVLISNKKLNLKNPQITQIMPYVLEFFSK